MVGSTGDVDWGDFEGDVVLVGVSVVVTGGLASTNRELTLPAFFIVVSTGFGLFSCIKNAKLLYFTLGVTTIYPEPICRPCNPEGGFFFAFILPKLLQYPYAAMA